ncbi:MAG: hypothetical protein Q7R76_04025, partial [Candidatus Woesearchaeota archaeon]|nr:hypothetical protein [Candidatus Woesearchaeota archaeon]
SLPVCGPDTQKLVYNDTFKVFTCETDQSAAGASQGAVDSLNSTKANVTNTQAGLDSLNSSKANVTNTQAGLDWLNTTKINSLNDSKLNLTAVRNDTILISVNSSFVNRSLPVCGPDTQKLVYNDTFKVFTCETDQSVAGASQGAVDSLNSTKANVTNTQAGLDSLNLSKANVTNTQAGLDWVNTTKFTSLNDSKLNLTAVRNDTILISVNSSFVNRSLPVCGPDTQKLVYNDTFKVFTCETDQSAAGASQGAVDSLNSSKANVTNTQAGLDSLNSSKANVTNVQAGLDWVNTTKITSLNDSKLNLTAVLNDTVLISVNSSFVNRSLPVCGPDTQKLVYNDTFKVFTCETDVSGSGASQGALDWVNTTKLNSLNDSKASQAALDSLNSTKANVTNTQVGLDWVNTTKISSLNDSKLNLSSGNIANGGVLISVDSLYVNRTLPTCGPDSQKLVYNDTNKVFTCETDQTGGASGASQAALDEINTTKIGVVNSSAVLPFGSNGYNTFLEEFMGDTVSTQYTILGTHTIGTGDNIRENSNGVGNFTSAASVGASTGVSLGGTTITTTSLYNATNILDFEVKAKILTSSAGKRFAIGYFRTLVTQNITNITDGAFFNKSNDGAGSYFLANTCVGTGAAGASVTCTSTNTSKLVHTAYEIYTIKRELQTNNLLFYLNYTLVANHTNSKPQNVSWVGTFTRSSDTTADAHHVDYVYMKMAKAK